MLNILTNLPDVRNLVRWDNLTYYLRFSPTLYSIFGAGISSLGNCPFQGGSGSARGEERERRTHLFTLGSAVPSSTPGGPSRLRRDDIENVIYKIFCCILHAFVLISFQVRRRGVRIKKTQVGTRKFVYWQQASVQSFAHSSP